MDARPVVLLVDDDADMRRIAETVLQQVDPERRFTHRSAADGPSAIDAAREVAAHDLPLLVLCDYRMPTMDGVDVAKALRPLRGTIPLHFVMLSSLGSLPQGAGADAAAGVDAVLEKPFHPQEWRDRFREVLDGWAARLGSRL